MFCRELTLLNLLKETIIQIGWKCKFNPVGFEFTKWKVKREHFKVF